MQKTYRPSRSARSPGPRSVISLLRLALTAAVIGVAGDGAGARDLYVPSLPISALKQMTLEDLMNIRVTSVSKKEEPLSMAASAVAVITGEDIRRSGVTSLPDALRLAPGVHVGRVDSHQWAVAVRGFNNTFAQNLLVLVDGRSVYTPLFSGVLWQAQDALLEDLDRIEVIRGPGSTIWGANAVNGVINIVSKPAKETQGGLVTGSASLPRSGNIGVRYGGQAGRDTFFRVYGKYQDFDAFDLVGGGVANDAWRRGQGGFRLDHQASPESLFTLQGDAINLRAHQRAPVVSFAPLRGGAIDTMWDQTGANVLGRWTRTFSAESEVSVQAYLDYGQVQWPLLTETRRTLDLDIRHRFSLGDRHDLVWGGGYRASDSHLQGSLNFYTTHPQVRDQIFNVFVQDEITLVPRQLRLAMGTKLEHNRNTGVELEPGVRLAWTPRGRHMVWASVARAVRTPSIMEREGHSRMAVMPPSPPLNPFPILLSSHGDPNFGSMTLLAYELGYRLQFSRRLAVDAAAYYNAYDRMLGSENRLNFSALPFYLEVSRRPFNITSGSTVGGEVSVSWQAAEAWRIQASLSLLRSDLTVHQSTGPVPMPDTDHPERMFSLRSQFNLSSTLDLDLWFRTASRLLEPGFLLPGQTAVDPNVPSYATVDVRLAWRPDPRVELSLVGQNLLARRHREFNPTYVSTQVTEVPRAVVAKLVWKY